MHIIINILQYTIYIQTPYAAHKWANTKKYQSKSAAMQHTTHSTAAGSAVRMYEHYYARASTLATLSLRFPS